MTMDNASSSEPSPEPGQPAPEPHDLFLEAYDAGMMDYLNAVPPVPVTILDIDHFIERIISDPAHPRAWNAGYLAGWIGGLIAVEGPRLSALLEAHHLKSQDTGLHLVEGNRS